MEFWAEPIMYKEEEERPSTIHCYGCTNLAKKTLHGAENQPKKRDFLLPTVHLRSRDDFVSARYICDSRQCQKKAEKEMQQDVEREIKLHKKIKECVKVKQKEARLRELERKKAKKRVVK